MKKTRKWYHEHVQRIQARSSDERPKLNESALHMIIFQYSDEHVLKTKHHVLTIATPIGTGGTSGCVIAARLAENSTASILVVETGASNDVYPATAIPAA
ncbi:hypothetical protein BTUL_0265g00150 [Botrytis tulipae]|uniref:Uncharacterized protein n=1 Tax=Botrytis tulipae TaxID=87230 RepID=A0A4Z1E6B7_9HELO|nr:hypothetical protein BTUL_0265g00150 [Botrytis tulipae]